MKKGLDNDELYEELFVEEEEEEEEEFEEPSDEEQQRAIETTFGNPNEEEEESEEASDEEDEEDEGGEESEDGEGNDEEEFEEEEVSDELDEILGEHEGYDPTEDEDLDEEDEDGGEDDEEKTEGYEPLDLNLDEEQFEDITSNPEKFSQFIQDVREDAVKQARKEFDEKLEERSAQIQENILRNIPDVVSKSQNRTQKVASLKDQFFNTYPDLKEKMPYVRNMTAQVSTEKPDWNAKQILQEVANRAKRDLGISAKAKKREQERNKGAGDQPFAGAGGRQSPDGSSDNRNKQEKIIDDTFS